MLQFLQEFSAYCIRAHLSSRALDIAAPLAIIALSITKGRRTCAAAYAMTVSSRKSTLPATLAALAGNGIFGLSFMFSRMALLLASPFVLLMYRFLAAVLMLSLVALWARKKRCAGELRFSLRGRSVLPLLVLGLIQPVLYFLCESYGVQLTNATVSGVIIALIPIAALTGGVIFMHELPGKKQVGYSLLSIAGVIVMTISQSTGGEIAPLGILLLIGAVLTGAAFTILSRRLSRDFSALERTFVMMIMAAACFTLLAFIENRRDLSALTLPLKSAAFVLPVLYLSLFSSVLAFLCLNYAATVLPVSKTTAFCSVTTVLSVFAGAVFLHEPLSAVSVVSAAVIILGVFGVQKS